MKSLTIAVGVLVAGLNLSATTITNGSFETPVLGGTTYTPAGATWVFSGFSGIATNSSGTFFAAPNGTQVGFLQVFQQNSSSFSETITGVNVGDTISFRDALRPGYGADSYNVLYNGTLLGSFTPGSTTFTLKSVVIPVGAASSGTLLFQSTGALGGDIAVAIDDVRSPAATVPEPSSIVLFLSGICGAILLQRRRRTA